MKTKLTFAIAIVAAILAIPVALFAVWTDRSLEFWFTYIKGTPVEIPYWMSLVATIVLNVAWFAINILTEIAQVALD